MLVNAYKLFPVNSSLSSLFIVKIVMSTQKIFNKKNDFYDICI